MRRKLHYLASAKYVRLLSREPRSQVRLQPLRRRSSLVGVTQGSLSVARLSENNAGLWLEDLRCAGKHQNRIECVLTGRADVYIPLRFDVKFSFRFVG